MGDSRQIAVDRRRLVKGAAWGAPAIVMATAVPAVAASVPDPARFLFTQTSATYTDRVIGLNDTVSWDMAVQNTGETAGSVTITIDFRTLATIVVPSAPAVTGWAGSSGGLPLGLLGFRWTYTSPVLQPGQIYQFDRAAVNIPLTVDNVTWTILTSPDTTGTTTVSRT